MLDFNSSLFSTKIESAFVYSPKILKNKITNRVRTALIFIAEGEYTYRLGKGMAFVAKAGDIVYLPPTPYPYEYRVDESKPTRTYQIEINLHESKTGKPFAFSKHPVLIHERDASHQETFDFICKSYAKQNACTYFDVYGKLYALLSICAQTIMQENVSHSRSKIAPAIDYLNEHFNTGVSTATLAKLCSLSESQLRRLFLAEVGKSPIRYKNELQLNHARFLLKNKELSITEIAAISGFCDTYAFSHFFSKETGISPSQFRAQET